MTSKKKNKVSHEDRFFSALVPDKGHVVLKKDYKLLAPVVLQPTDAELYVMTCPSHNGNYEIVVLGGTPLLVNHLNGLLGNYHKHLDGIKPIITFSPGTLYHWKGQVIIRNYDLVASQGEWLETVLFSSEKIPPHSKKRKQR